MPPPAGSTDPELANGEPPDYYRQMDRRLIVLETRFDTILPTLATKADLIGLRAELKADMGELRAEMHKWMTTTLISLFVGFGGMLLTMVTLLRPA